MVEYVLRRVPTLLGKFLRACFGEFLNYAHDYKERFENHANFSD